MPRLLRSYEDGLRITTFDPVHRERFRALNVAWLERYFKVEPIDEQVLGDPEGAILAKGGEVLFAHLDDAVVGTVALKSETDGTFELTKMAVDEAYQGRGFGKRLLDTACELAKHRGAPKVILYSQRSLRPAIRMYSGYGFAELPLTDARYARCDIKMEKAL
jgi:ribosomal protein S18 acetylase RimI-like enzyme